MAGESDKHDKGQNEDLNPADTYRGVRKSHSCQVLLGASSGPSSSNNSGGGVLLNQRFIPAEENTQAPTAAPVAGESTQDKKESEESSSEESGTEESDSDDEQAVAVNAEQNVDENNGPTTTVVVRTTPSDLDDVFAGLNAAGERRRNSSRTMRVGDLQYQVPANAREGDVVALSELTAVDAQSIHPIAACVFVANLPRAEKDARLQEELERIFGPYNIVQVKIRRDAREMPFAFCQFSRTEDASRAIDYCRDENVLGRPCRMEMVKAHTEFIVLRRDGNPITNEEALALLTPLGEVASVVPLDSETQSRLGLQLSVVLTFTFHDPNRDPAQRFAHHTEYRVFPADPPTNRSPGRRNQINWNSRNQFETDQRSLFIGNLWPEITHGELDVLVAVGNPDDVVDSKLIRKDLGGGRYNIFAFVEYISPHVADRAMQALSGQTHNNHALRVDRKRPQTPSRTQGQRFNNTSGSSGPQTFRGGSSQRFGQSPQVQNLYPSPARRSCAAPSGPRSMGSGRNARRVTDYQDAMRNVAHGQNYQEDFPSPASRLPPSDFPARRQSMQPQFSPTAPMNYGPPSQPTQANAGFQPMMPQPGAGYGQMQHGHMPLQTFLPPAQEFMQPREGYMQPMQGNYMPAPTLPMFPPSPLSHLVNPHNVGRIDAEEVRMPGPRMNLPGRGWTEQQVLNWYGGLHPQDTADSTATAVPAEAADQPTAKSETNDEPAKAEKKEDQ